MRPEASTTTPLPRRLLPGIRVDGCSRPRVVWMYATLCKRCLTSSTEQSMVGRYLAFTLSGLQMIAEEVGDPAARVREGPRVEGDGGAAALVRLVAISHLRQVGARRVALSSDRRGRHGPARAGVARRGGAGVRLVRIPGRPRSPALRGRHRRGAGGGRPARDPARPRPTGEPVHRARGVPPGVDSFGHDTRRVSSTTSRGMKAAVAITVT